MAHAKYAPSAAHRWFECPGSVALCAQLPKAPDSVYAAEGTFAHAVAAWCLAHRKTARNLNGIDIAGALMFNRTETDEPIQEFPYTEEMADAIQVYLDYVRDLCTLYGGKLMVEERVAVLGELCKGTADALVLAGSVLHVIDFKYGAGHLVEAERNPQLLAYGYGGYAAVEGPKPEVVILHIVQPRRADARGRVTRCWVAMGTEVWEWGAETRGLVSAIEAGERTELVPGPHCNWCPAAAQCPALGKAADLAVAEVFQKNAAGKPPAPSDLSPEALAKVLDLREMLVSYLDRVEAHARDEASKGTKIPGWKLVEVQGHRRWIDETEASVALEKFGVDPWAPRELVSPAKAEILLGRAKAAALVPKLVTRPVSSIKLVRQSDKRAEVLGAVQVFQRLDNKESNDQ